MSIRNRISRQLTIIRKLNEGHATFEEIYDRLDSESDIYDEDLRISIRTFQRDIKDIYKLYNIVIEYDLYKKMYKIIENNSVDHIIEKTIESLEVLKVLNIKDKLSQYLQFDKRKPQGTNNLYSLLIAIKETKQISFLYNKFKDEKPLKRKVEPYALQEFKQRWYVIANDISDNKIKTFALDRLSELELHTTKFKMPTNFNIKERSKHSFGIITPMEVEPEEVILSLVPEQGKYTKSLPLHESQQILIDNDEELRIKLTLYVTHDFFMELLSLGENVKVIQPKSLIDDLKQSYKNALALYK